MFLPPATKLRQGNVFTSVCQEFCPRGGGGGMVGGMHGRGACMAVGGACMAVGGHAWQWGGIHGSGGHAWQWGGACMAGEGACVAVGVCMAGGVCGSGGHAWWGGVWRGGHVWQMRCMRGGGGMCGRRNGHCSGWYASYWNAFLFEILFNIISGRKFGNESDTAVFEYAANIAGCH